MTYPQNPTQPTTTRRRFQALPFLIEEDATFYNSSVDDGSFANVDQFSDRHKKGCNLAYLDGSVSRFVSPKGPWSHVAEPLDLTANHLRLWARNMQFTVGGSNANEFGWVNNPM
jgi:prepilin-type processing-associated H-X9-DG protein